jgi:hypothetical protein
MSMDCVAVGRLVWVTLLLVGGIVTRLVLGVIAVWWQLWGIVWADGLFWVRTVGWPLVESVVGVVCVTCVGWFVLVSLVGVWLGWVCCRFRIWCVLGGGLGGLSVSVGGLWSALVGWC